MNLKQHAAPPRVPVILDTDIGTDIDDTWALAQLLRSPELDPQLILGGHRSTEIAEGLIQALRHPSSLPSAKRCTQFARRTFDWPIIAARVRAVYEEIL